MKKILTIILVFAISASFAQVAGTWRVSPEAAALGVGPTLGDISWWSNSIGDVTTRACYFDDRYVFNEDGTFANEMDGESWIEPWQGNDPESCGVPVAPHDGSNSATWTYDPGASTITLNGVGAFLGLAKVINEGELTTPGDAPASITYPVEFSEDGETMTINISIATGYWRFILTTKESGPPPPEDDISLPVTFNEDIDYRLVDFGGTGSTIIEDPMDAANMVVQTIRGEAAETWAGTTVAEASGLVPAIPFAEGLTSMRMRVYSPEAGIPILFKIEVWDNTELFIEVTSNTTVANEWETIYFDFVDAPDFDFANGYNKPVVFFNFGVAGADAGEMTFLWDDIEFVNPEGIFDNKYQVMEVYPNPATDRINIKNSTELSSIRIYSVTGSLVYESENVSETIDISTFNNGVYFIHASGIKGQSYSTKFTVN